MKIGGRTESLPCWDEGGLQKGRTLRPYSRGWTRGELLTNAELMMCLFDGEGLGLWLAYSGRHSQFLQVRVGSGL